MSSQQDGLCLSEWRPRSAMPSGSLWDCLHGTLLKELQSPKALANGAKPFPKCSSCVPFCRKVAGKKCSRFAFKVMTNGDMFHSQAAKAMQREPFEVSALKTALPGPTFSALEPTRAKHLGQGYTWSRTQPQSRRAPKKGHTLLFTLASSAPLLCVVCDSVLLIVEKR